MPKFESETIETVGQLRKLLEKFPDNKPIIVDINGNTFSPTFYNWADSEDMDISWPLAIEGDFRNV